MTEPTGFRQFCGSSSGSGFAIDSDPYRTGSKFFSASIEMGLPVTPTQASPFATIWRFIIAHPMLRSNAFDGFRTSTMTLPLNRAAFAGRRTSTRVVYGALAVRTAAGPGAGHE